MQEDTWLTLLSMLGCSGPHREATRFTASARQVRVTWARNFVSFPLAFPPSRFIINSPDIRSYFCPTFDLLSPVILTHFSFYIENQTADQILAESFAGSPFSRVLKIKQWTPHM